MKILTFFIVFTLTFGGCSDKKIEITPEYIINENWDIRGANSLEIEKMKVKKDSTINPFLNLNQAEILDKLEIDSSFIYTANVKIGPREISKNKKIYFNRDNGFYWWTNQGEHKIKAIGKLKTGTWYEISGLSYYYYVIYIDSSDQVHRFVVNSATNY